MLVRIAAIQAPVGDESHSYGGNSKAENCVEYANDGFDHTLKFGEPEIDGAVAIIEHAFPGQRRDILRYSPRQNEQCSQHPLPFQRLVQQQGQKNANRDVKEDIDKSPGECLPEHGIKARIRKDAKVL